MADPSSPTDIIKQFNTAISSAAATWAHAGVTEFERAERLAEFHSAVLAQMQGWVAKQEQATVELAKKLEDHEMELRDICKQLYPEASGTSPEKAKGADLMARLASLEPRLQELRTERDSRVKRFNALKTRIFDSSACMGLGVDAEFQDVDGDLSGAREAAFAEKATVLEAEQQNRRAAMHRSLDDCAALVAELELVPGDGGTDDAEAEVDRAALAAGADRDAARSALGLSDAAVSRVSARCLALTQERGAREARLKALCAQIKALWDRLDVERAARDEFFASHTGMGRACLAGCEAEVERLQDLKRERMSDLIEAARTSIRKSWDVLQYSDGAREACDIMRLAPEQYTEQALDEHEAEQKRLEDLVAEAQPLYDGIRKYKTIVHERDEFEQQQAEKARVLQEKKHAGSGAGAKARPAPRTPKAKTAAGERRPTPPHVIRKREEELRKRIASLPKRSLALRKKLEAWAEKNGPLIVDGAPFLETMNEQENAYMARKHEQMLAKKQMKKDELMRNKTYHSPIKRKIVKTKTPSKGTAGARKRSVAAQPPRPVMGATENTTR